jgi:hypothetical protein
VTFVAFDLKYGGTIVVSLEQIRSVTSLEEDAAIICFVGTDKHVVVRTDTPSFGKFLALVLNTE